jgi:hypothetical protein
VLHLVHRELLMSLQATQQPNGDVRVRRTVDHGFGAHTQQLVVPAAEWEAFMAEVRDGRYDFPKTS